MTIKTQDWKGEMEVYYCKVNSIDIILFEGRLW